MKSRIPGLAPASLLLLSLGCSGSDAPREPRVPVSVGSASVASVPYTLTANGMVEPLQSVAVQPQVSGPIVEVAFQEGDEVRAGQVLFRIDPRPFQAALAQAEAVLARDRVHAENAAREAQRYAALVEKGYVTQSQADQVKAAADAAGAVVLADEAAVLQAQLNLGYATIRAPIGGRTGTVFVKVGNMVRVPNPTPLVEINQLEPVLVRFTVPGRVLGELTRAVAASPELAVRAAPTDADRAPAAVAESGLLNFMDNAVDTTTGTITLKARFPNASRSLWPGQFLTVSLDLYRQENALTVPVTAVQAGQEGSYVYVVDGDGRAQMAPVTVGRTAGEVAVIAGGIEPGTRVVTEGQLRLFPGAAVEIQDAPQSQAAAGGERP